MDYDAVFREVYPPLFRYCHRMVGDADTAEDVAQEAFVRLVRGGLEGEPAGIRVWLFKVAANLVRDRYRVAENRRRLLEAHPVAPAGPSEPDRDLEREEVVARVRDALDQLPERDRTMLLMREEGFSYQEIADAVDVKASSVGTLVARAQKRFGERYTKDGRETA